jgi:hypothetical protein
MQMQAHGMSHASPALAAGAVLKKIHVLKEHSCPAPGLAGEGRAVPVTFEILGAHPKTVGVLSTRLMLAFLACLHDW